MADGADLRRLQRAAHAQHDRGRRLRRFAREQRPFRQHQMDAGELDAVDGADGARQFAFQRAQVIDVLDEAGGAERVGLVEDLVADAAALGQAGFGELHAQPRHPVLGHHQDGAVVAHLEGDALAFEILDDGGSPRGQVGEQRGQRGVVTRMMTKPKKPISAAVTATMAITRAAPRLSGNPQDPATNQPLKIRRARHWAKFAHGMVSIWLTRLKARTVVSTKKTASRRRPIFGKLRRTARTQ